MTSLLYASRLVIHPAHADRIRAIAAATIASITSLKPGWLRARFNGRSHLRIFFGRLIVLSLEGNYVWAALDEDALRSAPRSQLVSWSWDEPGLRPTDAKGIPYPRYLRPPSRNGFYDPSKDASGDEWRLIKQAHLAYLRRVHEEGVAPDHRTKSDPGLIDEIASWAKPVQPGQRSVAELHQKPLEALGEYVVLSNTRWFAVFPATYQRRVEQATQHGRAGPNLVVYKTKSGDPRDHYVIPFEIVREVLVDDTLSPAKAGGKRWNLTLGDGMLHVSHRDGAIDVSSFRGAPLLVERATIPAELTQPTCDPDEFEGRVRRLQEYPSLARPLGRAIPVKHTIASRAVYERCPDVKAWVLREANGCCELCREKAPFIGDDGEPFLEVHHVHRLADGGPDTVENTVALCPNCHRRLHHSADRHQLTSALYLQLTRLTRSVTETS